MVRHADDFVILCRTADEPQRALAEMKEWIAEAVLTLRPDKTGLVNLAIAPPHPGPRNPPDPNTRSGAESVDEARVSREGMRAVVLDLDQTLIRGEDVDWTLWLAACEGALGVPVARSLDWASFPVHTDHGLLASLSLRLRGRALDLEERGKFERLVHDLLVQALDGEPGLFRPIDGAAEFLSHARGRACIATGNLRATTVLKLRSAGLDRHRLPTACSEDAETRSELVAHALRQVGWNPGTPATSFGDNVWDVRAARVLGIGFVGVAQSDAHEARLRGAGALHVIRDFTDREAVIALASTALRPMDTQAPEIP